MFQMSYGMYHMSHVTCHNLFNDFKKLLFVFDKVVELDGKGSVINGVYRAIFFFFFNKKVYPVIARAVLQTPVSLKDLV